MKLELVLTYWKDGLFKSMDRIEADSIESLETQFELVIEELTKRINDILPLQEIIDDDIPF